MSDDELSIIEGLSKAVNPDGYKVSVNESTITLDVISESASRSGILVLSDNLTTASVTTLADFATIDYGKLIFPNGTITIMITNISGFNAVENLIAPTYGRLQETDVELRHSYLAKSAIRSTRMIDSICSQLINNVPNVESATGYENNTDDTDEEGRPPHSVEIIVDGGDETSIASIILDKKAAGIQTFGSITVNVATEYGDSIPVSFNRPEYIYVWMKVTLDADKSYLPTNYANLAINSIVKDASKLQAGDNMLSQTFNATYNFPILFSNLPVVPVGQHFLLSCSTSHSGSFFKWCHKMKPACFEFVSIKSKAVSEDVSHNCNFLFWCVSIH